MTSTRIRSLYESLQEFSTETQRSMCRDFNAGLKSKTKTNLADYFAEALKENAKLDQIDEPFLTDEMLKNRHQTEQERLESDLDAKGTVRVTNAMKQVKSIDIHLDPVAYSFTFIQREVPHLRGHKTAGQTRNKAWIDYIGRTNDRAILGEIKCNSDQNPFYAFIQLLTYLSELATPTQIQRATAHDLFDLRGFALSTFDLHILLTDFSENSDKWKLREPVHQMVVDFKKRLCADYPEFASVVGQVLCVSAKIEELESGSGLRGCWVA